MAAKDDRMKTKPLEPALARFVREQMRRTGTPGVAVGILHRGRAYAGGFGVTSIEAPAPVDERTLFQIGSTTKTYTATAVMRLVERSAMDLDAPVRRYVRDLRLRDAATTRRVTIRHLLTHMGGWVGDWFEDTGRGDDALARIVGSLHKVPQLTPLGSVWHYNNAGFYILGRAIERVTRQPYETAIHELLLEPLGMTRTFFFAEEAIVYRVAAGHVWKGGTKHTVAVPWALSRGVGPAGRLISDVVDQLQWARFHMGDGRAPDGKRLLRVSSMRQMQKEQAPAGSMADHVGLSWLLSDVDAKRIVAHGGTTYGHLSAFAMVPAEGFAVTVLTNSTRGGEVHREVVNYALKRYAGITRAEPAPAGLNGARAGYEGRFVAGLRQAALIVEPARGGFKVTWEVPPAAAGDPSLKPFKLAMVDEDRAVVTTGQIKGTRVEFIRDERGKVRFARVGGRLYKRSSAKLATGSNE